MEAAHPAVLEPSAGWPLRTARQLWHGDRWDRAWAVLVAWAVASSVLFMLIGGLGMGGFVLSFGLLFGGLAWKYRRSVRPLMARVRLDNLAGFVLLALVVPALEETLCWGLGNTVAMPVLWKDILFCAAVWLPWFLCWRFFLSKRYRVTEKEALLLAASTGLLYEFAGKPGVFSNPLGLFLVAPLIVVVYAAIFIIPMQLIDFSGAKDGPSKYLVAPVLPYLLSWPAAVLFLVVVH
jgi:hypothetical protein